MSAEQDVDGGDNTSSQHEYDNQLLTQSQLQTQSSRHQPLHMQHSQPQSHVDQSNSSSLVYDRTIKVPKTEYADHGSHGVAALPLPGGIVAGYAGTASGMPPSSSIQMQFQLQQMAAARAMLPHQQQQMMSPLDNSNGMTGGYPQLAHGNVAGMPGGMNPPTLNTTSSVGLMQALNAQMAANQQAALLAHQQATAIQLAQAEKIVTANKNVSNSSGINLSTMVTPGGGSVPETGNANADLMPGDIRNGKKRTSPSVPLHPSQLQAHHPNNVGMNAVAEEDESSCAANSGLLQQQLLQQALNPSAADANQALPPQGLLGYVLEQQGSTPVLPKAHLEEVSQKSKLKQPANKRKEKYAAAAPSTDESHENPGEILTNPSIPTSNSGLDNAEGNLIVRRGDRIRVPRKNVHYHPPSAVSSTSSSEKKDSKSNAKAKGTKNNDGECLEYKVVTLLGQGTFAQVFHCIEEKSGGRVAVKIVKNKPAYTRQAAVEIDVFRKLNATVDGESDNTDAGSSGDPNDGVTDQSRGLSTSTSVTMSTFSSFDSSTMGSSCNTGENAIIRLKSYFMHSSHLCLVFEMLGPNLYELLKKRQFRGLPIGAVRTLIRQATEGIKLLGRRNVVHCDLKPENILMVRSDDLEGAIVECKIAGEQDQQQDNLVGDCSKDKASIAAAAKLADPNSPTTFDKDSEEQWIKLIDFGSACFEGQTTHTYIQSRFYRSPEVLIGLPYDSAIDIWSLGCVAAELFLGLPILPGVHEHDQLGRILEMIGPIPDFMLEQGSKSSKFYKKLHGGNTSTKSQTAFGPSSSGKPSSPSAWEFKTRQEYINFLTEEERRSKGGLSKLEQQQTNRYFKKKRLEDIVMHHGVCNTKKEQEQLCLFVHFLKGVLDPDPWKRWTAHQASMHPFLTGSSVYRIKSREGDGAKPYDIHWVPPWDASISKRKLMLIQKTKEKAVLQANKSGNRRLSYESLPSRNIVSQSVPESSVAMPLHHMIPAHLSTQALDIYGSPLKTKAKLEPQSPAVSVTSQMAAMADAMSLERAMSNISSGKGASPPQSLGAQQQLLYNQYPSALSASLGGVGVPLAYQQLADIGATAGVGRSFSETMHADPLAAAAQHQLQASLSTLNDMAFLQHAPSIPPPPPHMGAQSFSGAYYQGMPGHYPYVESELGYALQRPGVVPGMGNDAYAALRRKSSSSNLAAALAKQQMFGRSLSNLSSSTPQNPGGLSNASFGPMNHHSMSPGGLVLQQLGLQQEQMLGSQYNSGGLPSQGGAGAEAGASLLTQQLEEYQTAGQQGGPEQQSHQQLSILGGGSYHGGYDAAPAAAPASLTSNPYARGASFGEYGDVTSSSLVQQQQQQQLARLMHLHQLQMNSNKDYGDHQKKGDW